MHCKTSSEHLEKGHEAFIL